MQKLLLELGGPLVIAVVLLGIARMVRDMMARFQGDGKTRGENSGEDREDHSQEDLEDNAEAHSTQKHGEKETDR